MAPYAFSVTKSITWRNHEEFFSNVYHYEVGPATRVAELPNILDAIVVEDKKCHKGSGAYKTGRVWGPTNQGQVANETRVIKDLTGLGTMASVGGDIYKEATVLVSWYMGRIGAGGRKVWLRKFFHAMALPVNGSGSLGEASLTSANKAPFITAGDNLKNISANGVNYAINSHDGTGLPVGTNTVVDDYLHVRQF